MTSLLYVLFILPLSRLPTPVLHGLSDFLFLLIFRVFKYRRKVVEENLRRSFPERSEDERRFLAQEFFRHFSDLIVESLKSFSISNEEILRRVRVVNPEILDRHHARGKDVVIGGGHYNNWEWFAVAIDQQVKHQALGIYKPLSNVFLDRKMRDSRSRFGLEMIPIRSVPARFAEAAPQPRAFIFGVDQSPGNASKAHWMRFLHQETPVQYGAEKYAREHDLPVVFAVIRKPSRGHYTVHFEEVTDQPRNCAHAEIMEKLTRMLEKEILQEPRYWLWSHRRWKHRAAGRREIHRG